MRKSLSGLPKVMRSILNNFQVSSQSWPPVFRVLCVVLKCVGDMLKSPWAFQQRMDAEAPGRVSLRADDSALQHPAGAPSRSLPGP